jgi:hypothetical protein
MAEIVTIATFTLPTQLSIVKGRLEAEGIECFVKDELTVQVNNFYSNAVGGIKLQVCDYDVEKATEILTALGYIKPEDFQKPSFWDKMDILTKRLPLIKKFRVELRLLILVGFIVSIIITSLYYLSIPSKYERLTSNYWELEYITYDGNNYTPYTQGPQITLNGIYNTSVSFRENGTIIFPGFNTHSIWGSWKLENGKLVVSNVDTLDYVFEGKYSLDFQDKVLILESDKTVIYCYQTNYY